MPNNGPQLESYSKHGINVVSGRSSEDIISTALLIAEYLTKNCNSDDNSSLDKYGCSRKPPWSLRYRITARGGNRTAQKFQCLFFLKYCKRHPWRM